MCSKYRLLLIFLLLAGSSCDKTTETLDLYQHPIPFEPKQYICYQIESPLSIDGKLDEPFWELIPATEDFQDIEGDLKDDPDFQTYAKMCWDSTYFYVGAYMEEAHIWGTLLERDAVIFHDNDFEIFIDPDGDTHHYYEFEMNALNTIWDLLLIKPYREPWGKKVLNSWDIRGIKTAVNINGTLNDPTDEDQFWSVEIAIPWKVLREMNRSSNIPKDGDQWRVNFSRVEWRHTIQDGKYSKKQDPSTGQQLREENWVWSPMGYINMHMPEAWGYVQFSSQKPGKQAVTFEVRSSEEIKWFLRRYYYMQAEYYKEHKRYVGTKERLGNIESANPDLVLANVELFNYPGGYVLSWTDPQGSERWCIREDGEVWQESK